MSSEAVRAAPRARAALERPRPGAQRRRPSAWHLLLAPLALIFIFPFVQMVLASFMTTARDQRLSADALPAPPDARRLPHGAPGVRLPDLVQELA